MITLPFAFLIFIFADLFSQVCLKSKWQIFVQKKFEFHGNRNIYSFRDNSSYYKAAANISERSNGYTYNWISPENYAIYSECQLASGLLNVTSFQISFKPFINLITTVHQLDEIEICKSILLMPKCDGYIEHIFTRPE